MSGEFHNSVEDVKYNDNVFDNSLTNNSLACDLCNVTVTSAKILQRHLDGRKHKMKAERNGKTYICEMCDVVANSQIQLSIHLNSIKHKNKLSNKDGFEFLQFSRRTAGIWILVFCVICIFINLLLVLKVICD